MLGELLRKKMLSCSSTKSYEGCLSGVVSAILQKLMTKFAIDDVTLTNLEVVHQTYVPQKTSSSADISIMDCCSCEEKVTVHSILEVDWDLGDSQFPESQACSCASWFNSAGSLKHTWLPTFVLTKRHYQIGVAFKSVRNHWGFAEIEMYSKEGQFGAEDEIPLLRFAKIFCWAAQYHRSYTDVKVGEAFTFVDKTGKAFRYTAWIGARVLADELANKIVKFYSNKQAAESALRNQKLLESALAYASDPQLIEGCGGGMSAIVDDLYEEEIITYKHLIDLTTQVELLYQKEVVHGDLRPQNIMFLKDGVVRLVDFEWSGKVGVARFPKNVNISAFGPKAWGLAISGGGVIPRKFDWHCLADILDQVSLSAAAEAALSRNKEAIIRDLTAVSNTSNGMENLRFILKPYAPATPNLGFAGGRLRQFYGKSLTKQDIASSRKRGASAAALAPS